MSVQVDVVTQAGRPAGGVTLETLAAVRAALPGARLEVHRIRRDAGPAPLDAVLGRVPAAQPQRVALRLQLCGVRSPLPRRVRAEVRAGVGRGRSRRPARRSQDAARRGGRHPGDARHCGHDTGPRTAADRPGAGPVHAGRRRWGGGPDNTAEGVAAVAVHLVSGRALLRHVDPASEALEGAR